MNSAKLSSVAVPVVAIDGPSGSGKGTISTTIAGELGWHYLDSGAVYRVLGYLAETAGIGVDDVAGLVRLAQGLSLEFRGAQIWSDGVIIHDEIRTEQAGKRASMVSPIPEVRKTLLQWQRDQARFPGLVADGRDMGSVVFPHAMLKIFLTASAESRAIRRFKQLRDKGFDVSIRQLLGEITERDERDSKRKASPLKAVQDAMILDTTEMTVAEVVDSVMQNVNVRLNAGLV